MTRDTIGHTLTIWLHDPDDTPIMTLIDERDRETGGRPAVAA